MNRGIIQALLLILFSGCCDESLPRIQPHWLRALENYDLAPFRVLRRTSDGVTQLPFQEQYSIGNAEDLGVAWSFSQANHPYGFWFEIENNGGRSVSIQWREARYEDEGAISHEVYAQPRGALPDDPRRMRSPETQLVAAREKVRPTIVPIYKQYLVASGCRDRVPYSEPLIPTQLKGKTESQMQAYVADLYNRGVPVRLVIPVEIDGTRYEYAFEFSLRERWKAPNS